MANPNFDFKVAFLQLLVSLVPREQLEKRYVATHKFLEALLPVCKSHPDLGGTHKLTVEKYNNVIEAWKEYERTQNE